MSLTVDDLIKIKEDRKRDLDELKKEMYANLASKSDLNVLKDLILEIHSRLDINQVPFIEKAVDANSERIDSHEVRISHLEQNKSS